ncbi:hypothetical protein R3X27_06330 [Tropicimonas sp. TH_r6]|uniref:hypothetical protein n=1 Tax=Tropicimonas sp. TH_r6 TaxID=3082085 RepID=UPI0029534BF3|nr:hypothetical protein [Tropicimonas sp. TH_r6]MDV7142293.1 hypothetical protein [Tropicimonas sp. TH_r6]
MATPPPRIEDDYSGAVDWNLIYAQCHEAVRSAERIAACLDPPRPLLFAGFPETAACLAANRPVTFVDISPAILDMARRDFPGLTSLVCADVFETLETVAPVDVAVTGRLTAFWDAESVERFARALERRRPARVLVDFFDREAVAPGQTLAFGGGAVTGQWRIADAVAPKASARPKVSRLQLALAYDWDSGAVRSETRRSFFDANDLSGWLAERLPGYDVQRHDALIAGDPSFAFLLTRAP